MYKTLDRLSQSQAPAPTAYQQTATEPKSFTEEYKPFRSASERFQESSKEILEATPGY